MSTLTLLLLVVCLIHNAAGACTFPSDLTGTWVSSDRGSLIFNSSHVADYAVYNQGNLVFACDSLVGNYYILKSEEFTLFSSPAIAVMCITFTSLKTSLYKYQIHTSMLVDAEYQRIRFAATGTTVDSSLACTDLGSSDYYLLMADGQISTVKEQCPDVFLGTFGFSFNESDCANNTGSLDVCTDLKTMTFNYTECSTVQAYSSGGSLNCVYSSTTGDVTTLNVYNQDSTTDETSTFRFTCYVIEQTSGSSNVYATQHPKDCHVNQTSTYVPAPGANLTMLASVTCVPSTEEEATSVSQAGLYAGVAAGLIVLLLLVLLIVCFYCYKKKSKVQPAGKAPIDTEPLGEHPDTACFEVTETTTEHIEIAQDDFGSLHDKKLNGIHVPKLNQQTTYASISLNGKKDVNLHQLKRNDRQSSIRFTVSNLKKKPLSKRAKTESKPKPTTKPTVPKKKLPWPALFLPQDNDAKKEREREKKETLSTESSKLTQVSRETSTGVAEEKLKETDNEQRKSPDIIQQETTSKPTELIQDDQKEDNVKEDDILSTTSEVDTQEETTGLGHEEVSRETVIIFAEENDEKMEQINYPENSQNDATKNGTEMIKDDISEKIITEIKNASIETLEVTQEDLKVVVCGNKMVNNNDKNGRITDEQEDKNVIPSITEQEESVVFKTIIKDECEPVVLEATLEAKNDSLNENSTSSDLKRNESVADSGVYSNSNSTEPNADSETVPPGRIEGTSIESNTNDYDETYLVRTVESPIIDLTAIKNKTTNDSMIKSTESSSLTKIEDGTDDNNDRKSVSGKKSLVSVQSDNEKKDPVLNEINPDRNVYVDMLKDIMASDGIDSKLDNLRIVPGQIQPHNISDDMKKDDIVTTRHIMLTQKAEMTTVEETEFPTYRQRVIDKETNMERERTHYSIERNVLPSIGKQDYIDTIDKKEKIKQIKEKRSHNRKQRMQNADSLKNKEHPPTEKRDEHMPEPITTVSSDEKHDSQVSSFNRNENDILPKLVRAPQTDNEENENKQLPLVNTNMEQTLTNHDRKSVPKPKKKKFSFLPSITNASMFADEFEKVDDTSMSCENDSSETNLGQVEEDHKSKENDKSATSDIIPTNEETVCKDEKNETPPTKLPDTVDKPKPTKRKRVHHKPKGLSLPNLMGGQRHSAPEFRLPVLSSEKNEAHRRPESFKENNNKLTVPLQENRALVQGPAEAAWIGKESTSKSKKGNKDNKPRNVTGKPKEKQNSKKISKDSEKPKRKRRRKKLRADAVEDDEEVDTSKYFNDKERAGKVRPGDKDDLQGLILRIRETTMTDFNFQNNYSDESPDD